MLQSRKQWSQPTVLFLSGEDVVTPSARLVDERAVRGIDPMNSFCLGELRGTTRRLRLLNVQITCMRAEPP